MRITFPYMGPTFVYKKLIELLGHEVVMPPRPSQRTIDLGVKYSPEFACFPYKVIMGTYLEALEAGAETIVTSGGNGPCRAGFYSEVHKKTLQNMGFTGDVIVFDDWKHDLKAFVRKLKQLKGKNSWLKLLPVVWMVYKLAHAMDDLQKRVEIKRAYELEKGVCTRLLDEFYRRFDREAWTVRDIKRIYRESLAGLESVRIREVPEEYRIRLGIVGEIYVVMESSINMGLAELLNNLGCEVVRSISVSEWIDHACFPKLAADIFKKGGRYLEIPIGGHAKQTIGHIIDFKERGFDGVIHLMPFACLPELVSQSIIPRVSADYQIPVLTLAIDEQTGVANSITRIEAFVDLVRKKKQKKTA